MNTSYKAPHKTYYERNRDRIIERSKKNYYENKPLVMAKAKRRYAERKIAESEAYYRLQPTLTNAHSISYYKEMLQIAEETIIRLMEEARGATSQPKVEESAEE
jgi:hypothetical protein